MPHGQFTVQLKGHFQALEMPGKLTYPWMAVQELLSEFDFLVADDDDDTITTTTMSVDLKSSILDIKKFSKKHPKVLFEITPTHDEVNTWRVYISNGKMQKVQGIVKVIYPQFDAGLLE